MRPRTAIAAAAIAVPLGIRIARSRHRRSLHPDGRSFAGELQVWGMPHPSGARLIDHPARHPATVRISKGVGTRAGRPDLMGLAVRAHGFDLLLSTAGHGRALRHVPLPRRDFDARYGSILPYRTGSGAKVYLAAEPDPAGTALGDTLESVVAAAGTGRAALLLGIVADDDTLVPFGQVTLGAPLSDEADAALAFDPIRNTPADLHPTGTIHGTRAFAYRLSERWRGADPPADNPAAVTRTATHR